jgi:hypothetical protein
MKPAATLKKPSLDTAAALRFATQEAPQAAVKASARGKARLASAGPQNAANAVSKSGKRAFFAPEGDRRLTINLRADLHKKLKLMAVEQETTIGEIIEALVERDLK